MITDETINNKVKKLIENKENIILVYALNGTGKTRLSVAYKNETKNTNGDKTGIYFNAYSEDLFHWDNKNYERDNNGQVNSDIKLLIKKSVLNKYHSTIVENNIEEYLQTYNLKLNFRFQYSDNNDGSIQYIQFYSLNDGEKQKPIKISRGEERLFIWCFYLVLFDKNGLINNENNQYIFIDDPVSSLDDNNIFITTCNIFNLIKEYSQTKKIIILTHNIYFYNLLYNWIDREKKVNSKEKLFAKNYKGYILKNLENTIDLFEYKKNDLLYHLFIMNKLNELLKENKLDKSHIILFRQMLESIASFLGINNFSAILKDAQIDNSDYIANILNDMSHKKTYSYESIDLNINEQNMYKDILSKIIQHYKFDI